MADMFAAMVFIFYQVFFNPISFIVVLVLDIAAAFVTFRFKKTGIAIASFVLSYSILVYLMTSAVNSDIHPIAVAAAIFWLFFLVPPVIIVATVFFNKLIAARDRRVVLIYTLVSLVLLLAALYPFAGDYLEKNSARTEVAQKFKSSIFCRLGIEGILLDDETDFRLRDECYYNYAMSENDEEACLKIRNEKKQVRCKLFFMERD